MCDVAICDWSKAEFGRNGLYLIGSIGIRPKRRFEVERGGEEKGFIAVITLHDVQRLLSVSSVYHVKSVIRLTST